MNLTVKILLTYYVGGRLLGNKSSKMTKKVVKGVDKLGYPEHKTVYANAPKEDLVQEEVPVRLNISEFAYQNMISADAVPDKMLNAKGRAMWKNFSKKQRIEYHLLLISEGRRFEYEIVE